MGFRPDGSVAHNGMDHWWDDQGNGNCWEGNTYSRGHQTDNFTVDPPSCATAARSFTPGLPVKDAGFLSCSQYDRSDETWRHPPGLHLVRQPEQAHGRGPVARRAGRGAGRLLAVAGPGGRPAARPARHRRCAPATSPGANDVLRGRRGARLVLLAVGLAIVLVAGVGYAAVRTRPPALVAQGPTGVGDRAPVPVFTIADRRIRQVRYLDRGTLDLQVPADQHRPPAGHRGRDRPRPAQRPAVRLRRARGTPTAASGSASRVTAPARCTCSCAWAAARACRPAPEASPRRSSCGRSGWGCRPGRCASGCPRRSTPARRARPSAPTRPRSRGRRADPHGRVRFPLETVGAARKTGAMELDAGRLLPRREGT